jgi:hypothetical protein
MTTPKIQALGLTQEGSSTQWKATGYVDGVGWLATWGTDTHRRDGEAAGAGGTGWRATWR